jgi:hypothetical protein
MSSATKTHVPYVKEEKADENELFTGGFIKHHCVELKKTFNLEVNVKYESQCLKLREKEVDLALTLAMCELKKLEFLLK